MNIDFYAKKIWDYMLLHHELHPADLILVLGSNSLLTAEYAAELYNKGFAPYVLCSGGFGKDTKFKKPEAEVFADVLADSGVPKDKILVENKSTNTGENILFSKQLLLKKNIIVGKIIAVQKPYMERRTYATLSKQWISIEFQVTSPQSSFEDYMKDNEFKNKSISVMVGDLLRIREYPKLGFQIEQEIPDDVWEAGQELIKMGYDKYLIK